MAWVFQGRVVGCYGCHLAREVRWLGLYVRGGVIAGQDDFPPPILDGKVYPRKVTPGWL